jgi:hypothetical protein
MRECNIYSLVMLLHHIDNALSGVKMYASEDNTRTEQLSPKEVEFYITGNILHAQIVSRELLLQSTHDRVWDGGGPFWMASKVGINWQQAENELKVLRQSIEADCEKRMFVFVMPENVQAIRQMGSDWSRIWDAIPGAKPDIEEAMYCYALERNTATVFHLMRIAEHGLRTLAKKLHVTFDLKHKGQIVRIEYADWQKVITAVKNKLDAISRTKVGLKRQMQLEKYSDAADHCVFMKDIWRNTAAHLRKAYSPSEAKAAMGRVHDFMEFVAKEFVKPPTKVAKVNEA